MRDIFSGLGERTVLALGLTQTIGYGTMYYAYGVLAPAIARDMGISLDWFFGVFTIGLLLGAGVAPLAGRQIDRRGARAVMAAGSVLASLALLACAAAPSLVFFVGAILLVEIAACFVLYDAAFAALTQIHRHEARRAITLITLIAGFASTVFWPLTQGLLAAFDWRGTVAIYAMANLLVCAPIHFWVLRGAVPLTETHAATTNQMASAPAILQGKARQHAFALYALAICLSGFAYSAFPFHMLRIIESGGFAAQTAALIAMVMGPAQVLARLVEILAGHRFDPMMTARVALASLLLSIALVLMMGSSLATAICFAALYGASQGLITIARGTVPLQLFGPYGYGALLGRITGLRMLISGAAPFLFSLAATHVSMAGALLIAAMLSVLAFAAFLLIRPPAAA